MEVLYARVLQEVQDRTLGETERAARFVIGHMSHYMAVNCWFGRTRRDCARKELIRVYKVANTDKDECNTIQYNMISCNQ